MNTPPGGREPHADLSSVTSIAEAGTNDLRGATSRLARVGAVLEVLLAFVFVHVAFRAFKHFTTLGQLEGAAHLNFTPGALMILFTICTLLLFRRSFALYGLNPVNKSEDFKTGLAWGLLLVTGAGLLMLLGVRHQPGLRPPTLSEGAIYGISSLAAVVLFGWLLKQRRAMLNRVPTFLCVLVFLGVLCAPLVVAWYYGRPFGHEVLTVLWLVLGAGCGEEIFYRGHIQSRVNESFGRPFRILGVQFGAGLLISSLLFGFLHVLNSVDYFQRRFSFAWGFGIANVCTGLFYGYLREATGGVLAGAITHAALDVLVIVPGLISGP